MKLRRYTMNLEAGIDNNITKCRKEPEQEGDLNREINYYDFPAIKKLNKEVLSVRSDPTNQPAQNDFLNFCKPLSL